MSRKKTEMIEKKSGSFTSFDGTKIHYEIRGKGDPIIFVYGIACLMNHYHHQITHFAKTHQVITFDLRGHNRSAIPTDLSTMTVHSMAEDLLGLVSHLKIKRAHFIGHSFGVPILIEFSQIGRKHSRSYTFINGFAKNPIQGMFGVDLAEKFFAFAKQTYKAVPFVWNPIWKFAVMNPFAAFAASLGGGFNLVHTEWKDIEIYAKCVSEMSLDMFIPLFEDMMKFDGTAVVKTITTPTLVMAGAKDSVTPLKFQEALHKSITASKYVVIPRGSHCTQLDFPRQVNRLIEEHINNVDFD